MATSCKVLTHWKSLWCWEGLGAGGEEDNRGWDGWMASLTWWTWVWVNYGSWWWTGVPVVLWFMGSQRVGHDWMNLTELNILSCRPLKLDVRMGHGHQFACLSLSSSLWEGMLSWPGEGGRGKEDKWAADQRESSLSAMLCSSFPAITKGMWL